MLKKEKIAIVYDDESILKTLENILGDRYEIFGVISGKSLVADVINLGCTAVLLDINSFEMAGKIADEFKNSPELRCRPTIFVSKSESEQEKYFGIGACDVITKPLNPAVVQARVSRQVARYIANIMATKKDECFKTLIQQTKKVIFESDFATEKIQSLCNFEDIFGRVPYTTISEEDAIKAEVIHPQDINVFKEIFRQARGGKNVPEVKIRIKNKNGDYRWSLISTVVMTDKDGDLYKAISTLEDIDDRVKLSQINDKSLGTAIANAKLCMFEYYIDDNYIVCSDATMETFGTSHIIENSVEYLIESGIVRKDYGANLREAYRKITEGSPMEQFEIIQFHKDGTEMMTEITLTNVYDSEGRPYVAIGLMRDLTDRLLLTKQAYYDELTGCRNLAKFKLDAPEIIKQNPDLGYMVVKFDIDRFKLLNEVYGYEMCDKILVHLSDAVEKTLDSSCDIHARINADEFIMLIGFENEQKLLEKIENKDRVISEYLQKLIPDKICIRKGRCHVEKGETDFNSIFEKVNFAHRFAKKNDTLACNYDGEMKKLALRQKEIESRMEIALKNEEYKVFLQPKYRLSDEKIIGAEALVRWKSGGEVIAYPDSFIPIFEKSGFITQLDMYMFEQACKIIKGWIDSGITPITVSVNFSRLHLSNSDFVKKLSQLADQYGVPHNLLEIEITETAIFDNIEILEKVLLELHSENFTLSMDDFGTGYSSLGLLKNIPVDVIKIDKSFFDDSQDNERAMLVIGSVMDMAKKLKAHTVAEGVETKEKVDLLKHLGCDTVQGYYYAKPMPAEEFTVKFIKA